VQLRGGDEEHRPDQHQKAGQEVPQEEVVEGAEVEADQETEHPQREQQQRDQDAQQLSDELAQRLPDDPGGPTAYAWPHGPGDAVQLVPHLLLPADEVGPAGEARPTEAWANAKYVRGGLPP